MKIAGPFPHENKARFESLVGFTAAAEEFRPDLIEKDYYCSLVLDHLRGEPGALPRAMVWDPFGVREF